MPVIGPVVINDGATTPVAHTFTPLGKDDNGVYWFEQTTPAPLNPLGAKRLGYKQVRALSDQKQLAGTTKVILTVHVPTLETLANNSAGIVPPPQLAYREMARVEFTLADRSTQQERKDTRVLTLNLLGHAMTVSAVDLLQPTY